MRVRYGKPIKVKSLLGQMNTSVNGDNKWLLIKLNNQTKSFAYFGWGQPTNNFYLTEDYKDHKIFMLYKFESVSTSVNVNTYKIGAYGYTGSALSTDHQNWSGDVSLVENNTVLCGKVNLSRYNDTYKYFMPALFNSSTGSILNVKYAVFIDLTEIGLDNLTAQEFYNKYNKYFSLIATGEEITIDDKSGQVANGILYGYNQKIDNGLFSSSYNTSGWAGFESSISIVDGKLRCTPNYKTLCGFKQDSFKGVVGHKYYINVQGIDLSNIVNDNITQIYFSMNAANATFIYRTTDMSITSWQTIYECPNTSASYLTLFRIYLTFNNGTHSGYFEVSSISIIDLTEWYGAGNEPTTVADFKEKFTKDYYGYCYNPIKITEYQINALPNYNYKQLANIDSSERQTSRTTSNLMYLYQVDHKYLFTFDAKGSESFTTRFSTYIAGSADINNISITTDYQRFNIFKTGANGATLNVQFYGDLGTKILYYKNFQIIDLTSLFGEGNEPSTIEEFKQFFPNNYYRQTITASLNKYIINYEDTITNNRILSCKIAGGSSDIYYGYNQLLNNTQLTDYFWGSSQNTNRTFTEEMITIEFNSTFNTNLYFGQKQNITAIKNHKCIFRYDIKGDTAGLNIGSRNAGNLKIIGTSTTDWQTFETIGEITDLYNPLFLYLPSTWANHTAYIRKVNFIDLTEWFGSGKEPTTLAQFKEKFTKEYYGFCPTPIKLTQYQIEALPSYGYNNVALMSNVSNASYGKFSYNVQNGLITCTATADDRAGNNALFKSGISGYNSVVGHKVLFKAQIYSSISVGLYLYSLVPSVSTNKGTPNVWSEIYTLTNTITSTNSYWMYSSDSIIPSGTIIQIKDIQIIDLTDWYGAGNEPSTIEEFKATFPNKYYPYSKKRLLNKYMINKLVN